MNSCSNLICPLKTFVFVSSLLVFPEVALPDARVICADKIMEAGSKVRMRSAEVSALPNGLLRHSWSPGDIECDTIDDQIIINNRRKKDLRKWLFKRSSRSTIYIYAK